MKFEIGNFLDQAANVCIFPANGELNNKGELIMGAGAAEAIKDKYPTTAKYFGARIPHIAVTSLILVGLESNHMAYEYHVCTCCITKDKEIIALQTKLSWRDPSPLSLVKDSLLVLRNTLIEKPSGWTFSMAYPGIGRGGLNEEEVVKPLLHQYLDIFGDRLTIWSLE